MQLHTLHHIHDGAAAINAVFVCVCECVCMDTHSHVHHSAMIDLGLKSLERDRRCVSAGLW